MKETAQSPLEAHSGEAQSGLVPIGKFARQVGISPATLRIWERRYGEPRPVRLPSGHRRYSLADIERMRFVAELLGRGQRPGNLLRRPVQELEVLSRETRPAEQHETLARWIELLRAYRGDDFVSQVVQDGRDREPVEFLETSLIPLLDEMARSIGRGSFGKRHESFAIHALEAALHHLDRDLGGTSREPGSIVLVPMRGERTSLAPTALSYLCRSSDVVPCVLGAGATPKEIASCAEEIGARAVGFTAYLPESGFEASKALARLAGRLPDDVELFLCSIGARVGQRGPRGVRYFGDVRTFWDWFRPAESLRVGA